MKKLLSICIPVFNRYYLLSRLLNSIKTKYPEKIVDPKLSADFARNEIWNIRKSDQFKSIAKQVYLKHGSRLGRRSR